MSSSGSIALVTVIGLMTLLIVPELQPDEPAGPATVATRLDPAADHLVDPPAEAVNRAGNGQATHEVRRSTDGRFHVEAQVNGARIRFLVDTGASLVALTPSDALRAGIVAGNARARALGAGGEIEIAPVTIDRLAVGPLDARQIKGAIVQDLPVSLLGQSFLDGLSSVRIDGDRMVLR